MQIVVAGGYLHDQEKVGVLDRAKLEDLKRDPPDLGMIDIERQRRQSGARVLETCTCATRAEHLVYFVVDDCDAATERVAEGGGAVQHGPIDSRYGRLAIVADPNGAHFSIIDVTRRSEGGPPAT